MHQSTVLAAVGAAVAVAGGCRCLQGADRTLEVLHVSVRLQDELVAVLEAAEAAESFDVLQVGLEEFVGGEPRDLSDFDAIVFGISDAYESEFRLSLGRLADLNRYAMDGGGIVWTHDSIEYERCYGAEIEEPAGIQCGSDSLVGISAPEIEVCEDHEVLHEPFEIGDVENVFPKTIDIHGQHDHASGGIVTTGRIILRHRLPPDPMNFYLTVNEYGSGRVAVSSFGHVLLGHSGQMILPSMKEAQIFTNALHWCAAGSGVSPSASFRRGDADANGALNISDAVVTLNYLFLSGPGLACMDAADADDTGALQITDAIWTLSHLFLGGPAPPEPLASCGKDGTPDELGCPSFPACQ